MLMTQGDLAVLIERPVSRALLIAWVGVIVLTILLSLRKRRSIPV
jgi:TctA family transporter